MTQQSPQLKVDLRGLFPTPVAIARLPDAGRLNAELKHVILERERTSITFDLSIA